eukprot:4977504-Pleurochrysis_carterae.AAC.7
MHACGVCARACAVRFVRLRARLGGGGPSVSPLDVVDDALVDHRLDREDVAHLRGSVPEERGSTPLLC